MPENENQNQGWVGEASDIIDLGEQLGVWGRPSAGSGAGGSLDPEEARKFLDERGFGWLYDPGGPIDTAVQAQVNGLGGKLPNGNGAMVTADVVAVGGIVIGGVVVTGFFAVLILGALFLAKGRMG